MVRMVLAPTFFLTATQICGTAAAGHHHFYRAPSTAHGAPRRFWIGTFNSLPYTTASGFQFVDPAFHVPCQSMRRSEHGDPDIVGGLRRLDDDFCFADAHAGCKSDPWHDRLIWW